MSCFKPSISLFSLAIAICKPFFPEMTLQEISILPATKLHLCAPVTDPSIDPPCMHDPRNKGSSERSLLESDLPLTNSYFVCVDCASIVRVG